ncbi:hypothetical protein KQX54_006386 [Cotesia glomerata]|uniref:Uncharacterized protein n=1 Tax=Cotesia glomerata TaxID=32391 RepID=A0AAV7J5P0_COTGL|nr:hypothetical protein KQX54_006386 [Cotesia glomerata]
MMEEKTWKLIGTALRVIKSAMLMLKYQQTIVLRLCTPKTRCLNETLEYSELIPVIGDYRPIAPQLGEYKFIPKQRWLNSLDNDAVVLLYHPYAERSAINKLRLLIMKYYERYIFTPYNLEQIVPFAIVVKGCRLVMSHVVPNEVAHFLQNHGPKKVPLGKPNDKKPKYNLGLIEENRPHHLFGLIYQLS